jgi:hypothetical protein
VAVGCGEPKEYIEVDRALADLICGSEGLSRPEPSLPVTGCLHVSARCDLAGGCRFAGMFSELVTGNYFSTLGLSPVRGRFFLPEEDSTPGAHAVAVINYGTWQARFGGAADIIGKTLRLNNVVFTVIGVAPPQFIGVNTIFGPDLWVPAAMAKQLLPNEMQSALSDRSKTVFQGVGRFTRGVTPAQAQANVAPSQWIGSRISCNQ